MSYTQHVYSKECDRAKGILGLHTTDEPVLPLLRHSGFSVAQADTRDGTVSQAMAAGNRLRHYVSPNQIDDVGRVPVSLEQRLFQATLHRSRRLQRRMGGLRVSIRRAQTLRR